jgi:hypothetical protein
MRATRACTQALSFSPSSSTSLRILHPFEAEGVEQEILHEPSQVKDAGDALRDVRLLR